MAAEATGIDFYLPGGDSNVEVEFVRMYRGRKEETEKDRCIKCHKQLLQKVFQLKCGDRICKPCSLTLSGVLQCPSGKDTCGQIDFENPENIFEDVQYMENISEHMCPCKYKSKGCKTQMKLKHYMSHIRECKYGLDRVMCSVKDCYFFGTRLDFPEHLMGHAKDIRCDIGNLQEYAQEYSKINFKDDIKTVVQAIAKHEKQLRKITFSNNYIDDTGDDHYFIFQICLKMFPLMENLRNLTMLYSPNKSTEVTVDTHPVYLPRHGFKLFLHMVLDGSSTSSYTIKVYVGLLKGEYDKLKSGHSEDSYRFFSHRVQLTLKKLHDSEGADKIADFTTHFRSRCEIADEPHIFFGDCLEITRSELESGVYTERDLERIYVKLFVDIKDELDPEYNNAIPAIEAFTDGPHY